MAIISTWSWSELPPPQVCPWAISTWLFFPCFSSFFKIVFYFALKTNHLDLLFQQETPPAWTQEAHRPPRSKCSLCWSVSWGGGVPHSVRENRVPHPVLDGGYPKSWSWRGVSPKSASTPGMDPIWTWDGVHPSPCPDLGWGTSPPASVNRLKILPSLILQMRAVIMYVLIHGASQCPIQDIPDGVRKGSANYEGGGGSHAKCWVDISSCT